MDSPPVPPPDLDATVDDLTLAVGQLVRRLRAQGNPNALSLSQLSALARLEQQGAMTTADLARADSMKPQSMGAVLASLEQEGLVERRPHPTDGRQILFALTPHGLDERRQRGLAKRAWLLAAMTRLSPQERSALVAAIPLIRQLSEG